MSEEKEKVNHPDHYNAYSVEVIDMMVKILGAQKVADFCEINAFKYRMRAGIKGAEAETDLKKEAWYLQKAKELRVVDNLYISETDIAKNLYDMGKISKSEYLRRVVHIYKQNV